MLYQDSWRVGAGLSLSFSPRSSLFHSSSSRSHRIVSLPLFHRVTLSLFFSSFSSRSYSREVGSSPTGGWVEGEGGIFTSRARRGTHTYTHGVGEGGDGGRRGDGSYRTVRHIGGSEALFIGRLQSEKLFCYVPLTSRIFTTPTDLQYASSRFLTPSLACSLALSLCPTKDTTNAFCGASNWIAGPRELHGPHRGGLATAVPPHEQHDKTSGKRQS